MTKKLPNPSNGEEENMVRIEDDEPIRKSSRSRAKVKDNEVAAPRKTSRKVLPKPKVPEIPDLFNDDIVPVEEYVPPPPATNKVVEVSSDEEEVEKKKGPLNSFETRTRTPEPVATAGPSSLPAMNGLKDSEHHDLEKPQPIEDATDISMHEPGTQETVNDTEQELHTAPSTPPEPISREEDVVGCTSKDPRRHINGGTPKCSLD